MSFRSVQFVSLGFGLCLSVFALSAAEVRADVHHGTAAEAGHDDHGSEAESSGDHGGHGQSGGFHFDYDKAPLPGNDPRLPGLFVFSLILFVAFVFAARALVWTPLIAALDQREARVNQAHADAKAAKAEAEQLLAQHESKMAEVQEQVQEIVAAARKEAEQEKTRIIAEAEAKAKDLREQAIADIQSAHDATLAELTQSIDSQVAQAVEHVVGHTV